MTLNVVCLLIAVSLSAVVIATPASGNTHCIKNERPCVRSTECCGGCCQDEKCVSYAESCIAATNPCTNHPCPSKQKCYLQQVQCIQAPCPPLPACKSEDYDDDY